MTYKNNSSYTGNSAGIASYSRIGANYGVGGRAPISKPYDLRGAMKNLSLDRYNLRLPKEDYKLEMPQRYLKRPDFHVKNICPLCRQEINQAA